MAVGVDALIDFLLSEIALCGVFGADSADFHRFVQSYYRQHGSEDSALSSSGLDRKFYERVWEWVSSHPDIRIIHKKESKQYSLAEFEQVESKVTGATPINDQATINLEAVGKPSNALSKLQDALKDRLQREGHQPKSLAIPDLVRSRQQQHRGSSRTTPWTAKDSIEVFDDPDSSVTGPRLYASQNRVWHALTGHSADLKKVPSMEFILLSLIAASGANGITQPDLIRLSGQDKRSVPNRTNELARKSYITKTPVQAGKLRTSLCVHSKFLTKDHFLNSGTVEDVYQSGTFLASGFVYLLYNKLKDSDIVLTRDLRTTLDVPMATWNKRATQGALVRLAQTGMIKRFRIRRRPDDDSLFTAIKILREPRDEDINNLGFKRQFTTNEGAFDDSADLDMDGDTLMDDLEADLIGHAGADVTPKAQDDTTDSGRIPPQWTPERPISNSIREAVALGGAAGSDQVTVRNRVVGPFWRRPMESFITRMTDDWTYSQPLALRHLAIIRDQRTTDEKRYIHYVYRTFDNFQKAVDAGEIYWEGVMRPATNEKGGPKELQAKASEVNLWGFKRLNASEFLRRNGSATPAQVRSAIVHRRKLGPRWDNMLQETGYDKAGTSKVGGAADDSEASDDDDDDDHEEEGGTNTKRSKQKRRSANTVFLTPEQRSSLGLPPSGQISKKIADQIQAHRIESSDPMSIPDSVETDTLTIGSMPLLTREERIARGLPPRGRLGIDIENQLRKERGLTALSKKPKRSRPANEPALLSREQRLSFGWKGHGRLPQALIDGLRQERDNDVPLEESLILPQYMERLKVNPVPKADADAEPNTVDDGLSIPGQDHQTNEDVVSSAPDVAEDKANNDAAPPSKRKASDNKTSRNPKKQRVSLPKRSQATTLPEQRDAATDAASPTVDASISNQAQDDHQGDSQTTSRGISAATQNHDRIDIVNIESLKEADRAKYDLYTNRPSPGVYLNPFAKRKPPQKGRAKKAFIATFCSPRLKQLEWFTADQGIVTSSDPGAAKNISVTSAIQASNVSLSASIAQQWPTKAGSTIVRDPMEMEQQDHNQSAPLSDAMGDNEDVLPPVRVPTRSTEELPSVDTPMPTSEQCSSPNRSPLEEHAQVDNMTDAQMTVSETKVSPALETDLPTAVAAIEHSSTTGIPTDKALHTPNPPDNATPEGIPQNATDATAIPADGVFQVAPNGVVPLTTDGYSAIGEALHPEVSTPTARMKTKRDNAGSAVHFRRQIILELVEMCKGVFPDSGEIGRPFHTLWTKYHGHKKHIREPIASTVNSTFRHMCTDPKFNLKRMVFHVKSKQVHLTIEKAMIGYAHFTPSSPEVRDLAYKIANYSSEKSHQFFPEEIRHLLNETSLYVPHPVAPIDESITIAQLKPIEDGIKAAQRRQRMAYAREKALEAKARKRQNAAVEETLARRRKMVQGTIPEKRTRLASLNDKNKRYRRATLQKGAAMPGTKEDRVPRKPLTPLNGNKPLRSLVWEKPWVGPPVDRGRFDDKDSSSPTEESDSDLADEPLEEIAPGSADTLVSTPGLPPVDSIQTTSSETVPIHESDAHEDSDLAPESPPRVVASASLPKNKKRVRIVEPEDAPSNKKPRVSDAEREQRSDGPGQAPSNDPEERASVDHEEDATVSQQRRGKLGSKPKPRTEHTAAAPTLLERLTGLTGNPDDPVYQPPAPKSKPSIARGNPQFTIQRQRKPKTRTRKNEVVDTFDPDEFKRLYCALAIASSMSGEEGVVDWSIIENAYRDHASFDMVQAKNVWQWMQTNMPEQLGQLMDSFQTTYVEAYEKGRVPSIEDPTAYDWKNLVQWALRFCTFPELPLPSHLEALEIFEAEESKFDVLDRARWYKEKLSDRERLRVQLQRPLHAPMHRFQPTGIEEDVLKAKSWIRANTATKQSVYDPNTAHEKLKRLSESVLTSVVTDMVNKRSIKKRKIKRLLPGRNFGFPMAFAKKFIRPFELSDFMSAVMVKKDMDKAFANQDEQNRFLSLSRVVEQGPTMAILNMVSAGQIKLVPQLPPIDNELGGPLPRLSVWGLCEGDYVHRAIDRNRLFWDIHLVPTSAYKFGNPLMSPGQHTENEAWHLPEPPLPGKHDQNALLPIWSSIDGQSVTWPWWYRILILVLQPLLFEPGSTAQDIYSHCEEQTTELFEIELALQWLVSVGAVCKSDNGGYSTETGFWAAFGDELRDTKDDWFGDHIKRRVELQKPQTWRQAVNLRHARNRATDIARASEDDAVPSTSVQQILANPRRQYGIAVNAPQAEDGNGEDSVMQDANGEADNTM